MKRNEMLSMQSLENVNGGYVVCSRGMDGHKEEAPWQVIDDQTGKVLDNCASPESAMKSAKMNKVSPGLVGQDFVEILRDWRDY